MDFIGSFKDNFKNLKAGGGAKYNLLLPDGEDEAEVTSMRELESEEKVEARPPILCPIYHVA